ncbi:MAG: hypothetical protein F4056_06930 [Chloroflexi bacterium]|nr:hypothetical protein [Chloroflexota bacterium]
MGFDKKANARYEAEFVRRLKATYARSPCLVGVRHQGRTVQGHGVPASRLRLIAESRGARKQVRTFDLGLDTLPGRAAEALPAVRAAPQPAWASIDSEGLTRPFACAEHDNQLFEPIDGSGFDTENPRHCALVSYRTLLWLRCEALSFALALRRMEPTGEFRSMPISKQAREREKRSQRQLEANCMGRCTQRLHRAVVGKKEDAFTHRSVRLPGRPKLAFFGVCARGGAARWTAREGEAAPAITAGTREAVPFILTCYPDPSGHVAVASCPSEVGGLLPIVFPAFDDAGDDREALLSASALDILDQITIAPSVWDGYGDERQLRIWGRWARMPAGPRDALADADIAPLNLFD